ncbi:MAG: hypothetical protein U1F09_16305 [Steroidobacteraceae bacterium]
MRRFDTWWRISGAEVTSFRLEPGAGEEGADAVATARLGLVAAVRDAVLGEQLEHGIEASVSASCA